MRIKYTHFVAVSKEIRSNKFLGWTPKKWTGRRQDWSLIHAQLAVYFADRMPD